MRASLRLILKVIKDSNIDLQLKVSAINQKLLVWPKVFSLVAVKLWQ